MKRSTESAVEAIQIPLNLTIREVAERYLDAVFMRHNGHVLRTAVQLGLTQGTTYRWLQRGPPPAIRPRAGRPRKPKDTVAIDPPPAS